MGPTRFSCTLLLLWLAAVGPLWSQALGSHRQIGLYDFEEEIHGEKRGNYEKLPLHWYVMGRPTGVQDANFTGGPLHGALIKVAGYPSSGPMSAMTADIETVGTTSLHMGLNGGSAGAFLRVGSLAAVPRSDYMITAAVRTTPLSHVSACLVACFVDRDGRRIDASVSTSQPIVTEGDWQQISVPLAGDHLQAAWIVLQIELNQPSRLGGSQLGDRRIVYEQVRGGAWFEDIGVWQLPGLSIQTQNPVNIIRAPDRLVLTVAVRELSGRPMTTQARVYDHRSVQVTSMKMAIGGLVPPFRNWMPNLPRFGWCLVDLRVQEDLPAGDESVADTLLAPALSAFLWLGDE